MPSPLDKHFDPAPQSRLLERVILINIGIFLYYTLFAYLYFTGYLFSQGLFLLLCLEVAHVSINVVLGLIFIFLKSYRKLGIAMLLSALLIALVGVGWCMRQLTFLNLY
jgi:hypothetical protein